MAAALWCQSQYNPGGVLPEVVGPELDIVWWHPARFAGFAGSANAYQFGICAQQIVGTKKAV